MGRMARVLAVAAVVLGATAQAARADECASAGTLSVMLTRIDKYCTHFRLTVAGRKTPFLRAMQLGGEVCIEKGSKNMLQDVYAT